MIEWIKGLFGLNEETEMKLNLKNQIVVPEKTLDQVWIKKVVLYSRGIEHLPNCEIHCVPFSSKDNSYNPEQEKLIVIENALKHPVMGKSVQYIIDSLQKCIDDEPYVEEKT